MLALWFDFWPANYGSWPQGATPSPNAVYAAGVGGTFNAVYGGGVSNN